MHKLSFFHYKLQKGRYIVMHLLEIRQNLNDTSLEIDIYEISKIIRKLETLTEITDDLSKTDFDYISNLLFKSRTLLNKAYTIFKINNEEVQKNGKQKTD